MPATYQGTRFRNGSTPVLHLAAPAEIDEAQQRYKLDYITQLNRRHLATRAGDTELEARIAAYELAYRMQAEAPAVEMNPRTALRCETSARIAGRPIVPPAAAV